jgi:hypothetical protein
MVGHAYASSAASTTVVESRSDVPPKIEVGRDGAVA